MKIGAHFLPEDFTDFIECIELAEGSGYDPVWVVDSQMLWEDVWVHSPARCSRPSASSSASPSPTRSRATTRSAQARRRRWPSFILAV
jgi:hypothetical protein